MPVDSLVGELPAHSREFCPWATTCPLHRPVAIKPALDMRRLKRTPLQQTPLQRLQVSLEARRTRDAFQFFLARLDNAEANPAGPTLPTHSLRDCWRNPDCPEHGRSHA